MRLGKREIKASCWLKLNFTFIFLFLLSLSFNLYPNQELKERFDNLKKIEYNISFNGIHSGYIVWRYLGKDLLNNKEVDVLSVESDTDILKFLDLVSSEKIYLDQETHLPVKVKRQIELFGKKEVIEENYNQEEGEVIIVREKAGEKIKEEVYKQDAPIHNILELLYFFPEKTNLEEKKGEWIKFNLPNQKVQIRFHSKRGITVAGKKKAAYFLEGRGAKRFNLWLSLENKLPLRLDFISLLGKVIIRREKVK